MVLEVKNPPPNAGDVGDSGLIPGLGRSLGRGRGNPFQYFCLENPVDRRASRVAVYGVAEASMTETIYHGTRSTLYRFCDAQDICAHVICPTLLSCQLSSSLFFFSFYEEVSSTLHSP